MPYSPVAQIYGAWGNLRGPSNFALSLGDYPRRPRRMGDSYSPGTVLPPGVIFAAPGGAYITPAVAAAMAAQYGRGGTGPAGTRGTVNLVPNSTVNATPIVNRYATPAAGVLRTTGQMRVPSLPIAYEIAGATRKRPKFAGCSWWFGCGVDRRAVKGAPGLGGVTFAAYPGRTLGKVFLSASADAVAQAQAYMGYAPMDEGEGYNDVMTNETLRQRACELGQSGLSTSKHCKGLPFGTARSAAKKPAPAPAPGPAPGTSDVADAIVYALQRFIDGLKAGTVPEDAATPDTSGATSDPRVQDLLGQLTVARQIAHLKHYSPPVYTPPSTTPPPTGGGATYITCSDGSQVPSGTACPVYTGGTIVNQPAPVYTYPGGDPYGGGAGTDTVVGPQMTPSIIPTAGGDGAIVSEHGPALSKRATIGGAVGVLALGALGVYVWKRRKRRHKAA